VPRGLVALFALFEAMFVVGLGILVPFVVGLIGWASLTGIHATPVTVWQLAVQTWALGHGVPLHVNLGDSYAVLTESLSSFDLSLAPFAFAIVTVVLGRRAGRRLGGSDEPVAIAGFATAFVAGLTALVLASAHTSTVQLDVVPGTVRILIPFLVGLVIGWKPWSDPRVSTRVAYDIPVEWRDNIVAALRIAAAILVGLIGVASGALVIGLLLGFSTEVSLYESLHTGILGGLAITVAQLALVPVAVVWMVAWIAGPGFALGAGAVVSPFAATVGAVPAIPILGAIPESTSVGPWVTAIPVVIALIVAARTATDAHVTDAGTIGRTAVTALMAAIAVVVAVMVIGSYASGAAGPGRFDHLGINPILVGGVLAAGTLVGAFGGLLISNQVRRS
jgi:hypothetical protein